MQKYIQSNGYTYRTTFVQTYRHTNKHDQKKKAFINEHHNSVAFISIHCSIRFNLNNVIIYLEDNMKNHNFYLILTRMEKKLGFVKKKLGWIKKKEFC